MKFKFYFQKAWSLFTAVFLAVTGLYAPHAASTDTAKLVSEQLFVLDSLVFGGQGITNDGEYYYTSNTVIKQLQMTSLAKYSYDGEKMMPVERKLCPLPNDLIAQGYDHMGGLSAYKDKLYVSVEGGKKINACIVVFNTSDLSPTGEVYYLDNEYFSEGIPWVAVDPDTGLLYATRWAETDEMYVFDANNNMEFVKIIKLSNPVKRIQGGEFYEGKLYLSSDTLAEGTESCKRILKVNVSNGEVSEFALRDLGIHSTEAEGMTIRPEPDGSNLHILDWNRKTLTVYVRHYKVEL